MISLSVAWLILLVALICSYLVWLFKRSEYSNWETVLYVPVFMVGRLLWRVSFTNEAPPELRSGAILAANHRSSVDPFFVQLAARRRVHWMVAREYCEHFIFGAILRPFLVIPTNRSGLDLKSTKLAIEYAQQGRLVGMFPEGRLNLTTNPLLPIRGGAAMVAIKTGVPVIPLYIEGSPYRRAVWSPLLMPARVKITFGKPIFPVMPTAAAGNDLTGVDAAEVESTEVEASSVGMGTAESSAESVSEQRSAQVRLQQLIHAWGEQIVALSGHQGEFNIQLGSGTRSRR